MKDGLAGRLAEVTRSIQSTLQAALPNPTLPAQGLAGLAKRLELPALAKRLDLPGLVALKGRLPGSRHAPPVEPAAPEGADFVAGTYAGDTGTRPFRLYVPKIRQHPAPLLVMLHGCSQTAEDFAAGTRMNRLADEYGVLVLYPAQVTGANAQRCWNWFKPGDQRRESGEPAIVAGMVRQVIASYDADPARVFVAGLSAGGAQAAIMASAYPEMFAAIGVHSGLACGAASDVVTAFAAMNQGRPGQGRHAVPTIIFHGDADRTVNARNADEVAAQIDAAGSVRTEQGRAPGGLAYTRSIRQGDDGRAGVEQWTVHGAGHAWSGGSKEGSFTEPRGPDASREMLRFFLAAGTHKPG